MGLALTIASTSASSVPSNSSFRLPYILSRATKIERADLPMLQIVWGFLFHWMIH